jgi:PBP1b-binding outer membrane lipoprotein LpoB
MKNKKILFASILLATIIASCSQPAKESATQTTIITDTSKIQNAAFYQCPMDCENGKTYADTGKCPVCEMDLEKK